MNIIALIPARGGSKSIPLKNIQLLGGKPLIAHTILYAKKSPLLNGVFVSTDNKKIAEISKKFGAEVPFLRPANISGDLIQDFPVISHSLKQIESLKNKKIDAICWLRPTSPLRPEGLIERAFDILTNNPGCSSIRSVIESSQHPYRQWIIENDSLKSVIKDSDEPYNLPRQVLPKVYFQSGDIELVRRETILNGSISGEKVLPLIIKQEEMLDIDNPQDLKDAQEKIV